MAAGGFTPAITETAVVVPQWERILHQGSLAIAAAVAIIVLASLLSGGARRYLAQSPFATLFVILASGYRLAEAAYEMGWLAWLPLNDQQIYGFLAPSLRFMVIAAVIFVCARIAVLLGGTATDAHAIDVEQMQLPRRELTWRFPVSFAAWREFLQVRARVLRDPGAAAEIVLDPTFSPLGFRVRATVMAGFPAAVLSGAASLVSKLDAYKAGAQPDDPVEALLDIAVKFVQPYALVIGVLFAGLLASLALAPFRPAVRGATRQIYYVMDAARSAVAEAGYAFFASAFALTSISGLAADFRFSDLANVFAGEDGDASGLADRLDNIESLLFGHVPVVMNLLFPALVAVVWMLFVKNIIVPATIARLLGPDITRPAFAVVRFMLLFWVLPLMVAYAIVLWVS